MNKAGEFQPVVITTHTNVLGGLYAPKKPLAVDTHVFENQTFVKLSSKARWISMLAHGESMETADCDLQTLFENFRKQIIEQTNELKTNPTKEVDKVAQLNNTIAMGKGKTRTARCAHISKRTKAKGKALPRTQKERKPIRAKMIVQIECARTPAMTSIHQKGNFLEHEHS